MAEGEEFDIKNYLSSQVKKGRKKGQTIKSEDPDIKNSAKISVESAVKTPALILNSSNEIDEKLTCDHLISVAMAEAISRPIPSIQSMDIFYQEGIKQIITKVFRAEHLGMKNARDKTEEDRSIDFISFNVEFTDVIIKKPSLLINSNTLSLLTPNAARLKNLTYAAAIYVTAKITTTATMKDGTVQTREELITHSDPWRIATIPVMVKSCICNLYNQPPEILKAFEEDPKDPGGYFIINGKEWGVDSSENLILNYPHGYLNNHGREVARITFQSKPGDAYENSFYVTLRYTTDAQITLELNVNKFQTLEIPYYLIFRAFGITRDIDIIDNIVYGVGHEEQSTTYIQMMRILDKAFKAKNKEFDPVTSVTNSDDVIKFICDKLNSMKTDYNRIKNIDEIKDDDALRYVNNKMYTMLDRLLFPHIGNTPETRIRKLRFLGHIINKLLLIILGIIDGTDRDSYRNKRVHAAGVGLAKSFKTQFNFAVIQTIKKRLTDEFKKNTWSSVKLKESVLGAVKVYDLERTLSQTISSSQKSITIRRTEISNRIGSEQIHRKNDLNVKSILFNIKTHGSSVDKAKSTDRSRDMRKAHNTYYGFIGMAQSADTGEKVGMNKQMAITTSITNAGRSIIIKEKLLDDDLIMPLDEVMPKDIRICKLTKVFVNGDWIGLCKNGAEVVEKYRKLRRLGEINYYTTIVWEPLLREIYFWIDVGRLIRPLIIVYNNLEKYLANAEPVFKQWVNITHEHIRGLCTGAIKMYDLLKAGVIEYISPEEQENILLARNIDVLREHANNQCMQFTHCGIEQEMLGIVELSAPNTNHTISTRITMFTNQKKQTCGWFALNWPFRIDKHTFLQDYCEMPVVRAFSNAITYPNAQNVILAYSTYTGFGQEDSLILNKSSVDRGLFNGSHFYFEEAEKDSGERFERIDIEKTVDIKKDANYEFIDDNGFIKIGTIVHKGYVLISKTAPLKEPIEKFTRVDRSVLYKSNEPAIVEKIIYPSNSEDVVVAKVHLRSFRPLMTGDKLSSCSGCKGMTALMINACDMPFTEDGLTPDIIINPHSIPTRMVIGQLIETLMGELAVKRGCLVDGTPFKKLDIEKMIADLEKEFGIKYGGHRRMFNGRTGDYFDTFIFIGPTAYQRLQKFVLDESYAMSSGPLDPLTQQPVSYRDMSNSKALRIGEMEKDIFVAQGIMRTLYTKFYTDSDGADLYICRMCGNRAIVNEASSLYRCKTCQDKADIMKVPSSWVASIFLNEIAAMGVKTTFDVTPIAY